MIKNKLVLVVCIVLLSVLVFTGCGGNAAPIPRPTPAQPSEGAEAMPMFTVEGSCEAKLEGNSFIVSGQTNLMDGTNGVISVLAANGTKVTDVKVTKQGDKLTHTFAVEDSWPDEVYGFISFGPQQGDKQPKEVTAEYGKKFEYLTGPEENIVWNTKGVVAVFQSERVAIR